MAETNNIIDIKDFENFIYACESILKYTSFDLIKWRPNMDKEFWEMKSFYSNGEMKTTTRNWENNKDKIREYAHKSKSKLNHIVLVHENNNILLELHFKIVEIYDKVLKFKIDNKMGSVHIIPKNRWFLEFYDIVISYKEWFEKEFQFRLNDKSINSWSKIMEIKANSNFNENLMKCYDAESLIIQLNQEWKYRLTSIGNEPDTINWFKDFIAKHRPNKGDAYLDNILKHTMDQWFAKNCKNTQEVTIYKSNIDKLTYSWRGERDTELENLFNLMKGTFIDNETTLEQFKQVFTNQIIDENIKPIKWLVAKNLLAYFIDSLCTHRRISRTINNDVWQIAKSCFQNAKNLGQLRDLYLNNKTSLPKNSNSIDELLKAL